MQMEDENENPMGRCERVMASESFRYSGVKHPDIQLAKMIDKPFLRQLERYSNVDVSKEHGSKLFSLKVELSPYVSSTKEDHHSPWR
jgi:hypothetical protein